MIGREAYLATHVLSADPMELVCLLYQHAVEAVKDARRHLAAGNIAERAAAISQTIGILGELKGSLNREAGAAISSNLERLYEYMMLRLTEANLRREDKPLAEVESLLSTLGQAWQQARSLQTAATPAVMPAAPVWQETHLEPAAHDWSA
jgi:flagellar protein FliS